MPSFNCDRLVSYLVDQASRLGRGGPSKHCDSRIGVVDVHMRDVTIEKESQRHASATGIRFKVVPAREQVRVDRFNDEWSEPCLPAWVAKRRVELIGIHLYALYRSTPSLASHRQLDTRRGSGARRFQLCSKTLDFGFVKARPSANHVPLVKLRPFRDPPRLRTCPFRTLARAVAEEGFEKPVGAWIGYAELSKRSLQRPILRCCDTVQKESNGVFW